MENLTLGGYSLSDIKALEREIGRLHWIKQLPQYEILLAQSAVAQAETELRAAKQTLTNLTKHNT